MVYLFAHGKTQCSDILQVSFQKTVLYLQISEIIFKIHSVVTMNKQLNSSTQNENFHPVILILLFSVFFHLFLKATCFVRSMAKLEL